MPMNAFLLDYSFFSFCLCIPILRRLSFVHSVRVCLFFIPFCCSLRSIHFASDVDCVDDITGTLVSIRTAAATMTMILDVEKERTNDRIASSLVEPRQQKIIHSVAYIVFELVAKWNWNEMRNQQSLAIFAWYFLCVASSRDHMLNGEEREEKLSAKWVLFDRIERRRFDLSVFFLDVGTHIHTGRK